jgi:integrase
LGVLAAALAWNWREGKLDRLIPLIPVRLPAASAPRERHLTRAEAAAMLWGALGFDRSGKRHRDRINRHVARFILIGLYTGTRHDAILSLQWRPNTTGGWFDLVAGSPLSPPAGRHRDRQAAQRDSDPAAADRASQPLAQSNRDPRRRMEWSADRLAAAPRLGDGTKARRARCARHPTHPAPHLRDLAAAGRREHLRHRWHPWLR